VRPYTRIVLGAGSQVSVSPADAPYMLSDALVIEDQQGNPGAANPERSGAVRSITRQPILDNRERIQGYELLPGIEPRGVLPDDSEAVRAIIDDLVLFGYDRLTGGLPAFIRCSVEALADMNFHVLPPSLTVVEIPQSMPVSAKSVEACVELRRAGFRLALVDCLTDPEGHLLLDLVDYVKIDLLCVSSASIRNLRNRLKDNFTTLIAENVQSAEDYRQALVADFTLFQGGSVGPAEPLRYTKVPANRAVHIEILKQLFLDPLNLGQLCPLVMREPSLVYRLLRMVNSPVSIIRRKVESVQEAIMFLGEDTFRRMTMLAIRCELNSGLPPEIIRKALIRAKFCELAAPLTGLKPGEQYLLGLMSMLPAMLRVPVAPFVGELPLRHPAVEALLGSSVPEGKLLDWVDALERSQFGECYRIADIHKMDKNKLDRCYLDALTWESGEVADPHQLQQVA
jgi:c-di-GMP phosphodiesterase